MSPAPRSPDREATVRGEVLTQAQISEIYRSHLGVYP